ncbi:MAG: fumarylacetoacetate hydrolase family protein [Alphaproteobacteria bacterium]|nr:fumarylacetoacetate hydrolase family protein [Alphaproteobacteria bacterium]
MKLCRFDDRRLGLVEGERVLDVSAALEALPALRWPVPPGDQVIAHLDTLRPEIERAAAAAPALDIGAVRLLSPVANPSKIIGAPINYQAHIDEAKADPDLRQDRTIKTIADWGLFLKATSSLVGPSQGVALRFLDRRNDHELEFAAVIGRRGSDIAEDDALDHVAGYAMGFDMTLRGPELLSWRKSIESYAVLGPWLVTADEIPDPGDIEFKLTVNGEVRQHASTASMNYGVAKLIAYASTHYTLHPGDIILTGSPEGVAPVEPGDVMVAEASGIGRMEVAVRAA